MPIKSTLTSRLRNFFDKNRETKDFFPYIFAKKISFLLDVPNKVVADINNYYIDNCRAITLGYISQLNEKFIFNVDLTERMTYIFWNTRYQLLHFPNSIDFLTLLEGAKTGLVAPDTINRLYESKKELDDKSLDVLEMILDEETD